MLQLLVLHGCLETNIILSLHLFIKVIIFLSRLLDGHHISSVSSHCIPITDDYVTLSLIASQLDRLVVPLVVKGVYATL